MSNNLGLAAINDIMKEELENLSQAGYVLRQQRALDRSGRNHQSESSMNSNQSQESSVSLPKRKSAISPEMIIANKNSLERG